MGKQAKMRVATAALKDAVNELVSEHGFKQWEIIAYVKEFCKELK